METAKCHNKQTQPPRPSDKAGRGIFTKEPPIMPTAEIVTRAIDTATDDVFKCQTLDGPMKESIVAMLHNARKLQNGDAASQEANGRATGQIALTLARHILYHERRETEFDGRVEKAVIKALGSVAVGSGGLHVRQVADNRWRVLAILIVCATIAGTISRGRGAVCGTSQSICWKNGLPRARRRGRPGSSCC